MPLVTSHSWVRCGSRAASQLAKFVSTRLGSATGLLIHRLRAESDSRVARNAPVIVPRRRKSSEAIVFWIFTRPDHPPRFSGRRCKQWFRRGAEVKIRAEI